MYWCNMIGESSNTRITTLLRRPVSPSEITPPSWIEGSACQLDKNSSSHRQNLHCFPVSLHLPFLPCRQLDPSRSKDLRLCVYGWQCVQQRMSWLWCQHFSTTVQPALCIYAAHQKGSCCCIRFHACFAICDISWKQLTIHRCIGLLHYTSLCIGLL